MHIVNRAAVLIRKMFLPQSMIYRYIHTIYRYIIRKKCINDIRKSNTLRFMVNLTEHCNLNCACCNQFSPLANKKYYSLAVFRQDITQIFKLTNGTIDEITFLGGEPLLHPQITDFFDITRQFYNNHLSSKIKRERVCRLDTVRKG